MRREICVIIPTYNRCRMLRQCLDSLTCQTFPRDNFEVIVVDDGSSDETAGTVSQFSDRLNIRYLKQRHAGSSAARNSGLSCAQGDVIAFIDDDCLARQDWLEKISEFHRIYPQTQVLQGRYFTSADRKNLFGLAMEELFAIYARYEKESGQDSEQTTSILDSANFSAKRKLFEAIGGFDCTLLNGYDMDLRCRLQARGYKILYVPEIRVRAYPRKTLFAFTAQCLDQSFWIGRVQARWRKKIPFKKERAFSGRRLRLLSYGRHILKSLIKKYRSKGLLLFLILLLRKIIFSLGYAAARLISFAK